MFLVCVFFFRLLVLCFKNNISMSLLVHLLLTYVTGFRKIMQEISAHMFFWLFWSSISLTKSFNLNIFISIKCVEISKESKLAFENKIDWLPNSIETSIVSLELLICIFLLFVYFMAKILNVNTTILKYHFCNLLMYNIAQEPLSWLVGLEVLVVDPFRKGLDPSLISAFTCH